MIGYDLFWHLSFSLDIGSFFPVRFASTYYLSSHLITSLIAIPVTLSYSLFSALSQSYKREMFFPFESGKYRLSDYDLHYLFEVNESNHLLTNLQISSLRLQQDACHSSKSIHIRISPLYLGNHLNALLEPPPPQDICLLALSKSLSGEESLFFALDLSQYISNNQVHLHVVTPLLFNQSSASSILLFPPHLTSSGLQLYLLHYCGQLRNVILFDNCLQFLSARYHEFLLTLPPHHDMLLSSSQASSIDVEGIFDPITHIPFALRTSSTCFDSLWCDHTEEFQRRLHHWQNPSLSDTDHLGRPHVNCENAKFLIFEPFTTVHGIGSIILQISIALRFAICHGRILYLPPSWVLLQEETHRRWMADHCNGSILDCYFLPPSSCQLTELDIMNAPYLVDGDELEYYPLKMERVVAMLGLPTNGHCTVCGSEWSGDFTFFDGLSIKNNVPHESFNHLKYMFLFLGKQKLPWLAQMTRYLLRPRPWFAKQLQEVIRTRLSSPKKVIPRPFASIHVRYGEKVLEVNQVPLENYMAILGRKAPHIHHVFLSTETESVIHNLTR